MRADPFCAYPGMIQELLLDAILDVRDWDAVLKHLSGLLSARLALLEVHPADRENRPPCLLGVWGVEKRFRKKYLSSFAALNPWMLHGRSRFRAGAVIPGDRILGLRELVKTDFYTEFLRPQKVLNLVAAILADDENGLATLVFLRSREAGSFTKAETSLLRKCVPALQKAFQESLRIRGSRDRSGNIQEVMNCVQIGIVSLDERGNTVSMNRRAREILEKREALVHSSGRLECIRPRDARSFTRCLKNVLHGGEAARAAEVLAVRRAGTGSPLFLVFFPIRTSGSRLKEGLPKALVILMDPEKEECLSISCLTSLFGLSPAEARFASLLGSGFRLEECANRMEIRLSTVRTHLKHVFAKTRTSRQGELVRLLLGSAATCMEPDGN